MKATTASNSIFDLDLKELQDLFLSWSEPTYRAQQVWDGLFNQMWQSPGDFTNLPKSLRQKLEDRLEFESLKPISEANSKDGLTQKTLFELKDGKAIETVLMSYDRRRTVCVSTQAGCGMGCVFCATGQMGFRRNLTSGEIVEQITYFERQLKPSGERVTNVVVMGMGEPFQNYDSTLKAIDLLNHPQGLNLGSRRFTISTVGLVPAIRKFAKENRQINLAVSLHAADDKLRSSLLPINQRYPIHDLIEACKDYVHSTNRRISFEWALIQGVNDTDEQAEKLAILLKPFCYTNATLCHVNVIPLNPTKKYAGEATTHQRAITFRSVLERNGIPCTIRLRRGIDIQAGCGQLAVEKQISG
jgi:23S rRNA (adenine2503-C2)-methyltransferase